MLKAHIFSDNAGVVKFEVGEKGRGDAERMAVDALSFAFEQLPTSPLGVSNRVWVAGNKAVKRRVSRKLRPLVGGNCLGYGIDGNALTLEARRNFF